MSWENCCINQGVITANVFTLISGRVDSHTCMLRITSFLLTVTQWLSIRHRLCCGRTIGHSVGRVQRVYGEGNLSLCPEPDIKGHSFPWCQCSCEHIVCSPQVQLPLLSFLFSICSLLLLFTHYLSSETFPPPFSLCSSEGVRGG